MDEAHARVRKERDGTYSVTDLASTSGTWLNDRRLAPNSPVRLCPGDELAVGAQRNAGHKYRVKLVHATVWSQCADAANLQDSADQPDAERQLAAA